MVSLIARARFERARRRALHGRIPDFLKQYLLCPLPHYTGPAVEAPILSVDFETNGLDPQTDHILSIGTIAVDHGAIPVGSGWHTLVATRRDLDHSVVPVHRITHDMMDEATGIEVALEILFRRLQGRFLLAHHAAIETGFLAQVIRKRYGVRIPFLAIDTLQVERTILARRHGGESVRLPDARKRYGLPAYRSHHALTDALAAAELFLAQCRHHHTKTPASRLLRPFL